MTATGSLFALAETEDRRNLLAALDPRTGRGAVEAVCEADVRVPPGFAAAQCPDSCVRVRF